MASVENIMQSLKSFGESQREISAIYLFGSVFVRTNPHDLDIAVAVRQNESAVHGAFGYEAELVSGLMKLLHRNDIDLVLFHHASPLLGMEIVKKGKFVYGANDFDRVRFEKRLKERYLDTHYLRSIKEYYLTRRYREQGTHSEAHRAD